MWWRIMCFGVSTYCARSGIVIPAHTGIQAAPGSDPCIHGDAVSSVHPCIGHSVQHVEHASVIYFVIELYRMKEKHRETFRGSTTLPLLGQIW
jgi:hypothetical protein